jgi:hypothetical protein
VAVVLQLKAIGISDVVGFDFIDPPPLDMLKAALQTLYALQATVSANTFAHVSACHILHLRSIRVNSCYFTPRNDSQLLQSY